MITCHGAILMIDADDLLNEAEPNFGNSRACSTRAFYLTNMCATQKLLMYFVLKQGEMQLHLEALLIGNLPLPPSIGRPLVLTFSLQITYWAENLAKGCFMFYSAKNSLSAEL